MNQTQVGQLANYYGNQDASIQLRTVYGSMSSADLLYDSGWITAGGSGAINQETASNAVECLLTFTYSSNNTGCPTINEISSYIDFEFIGILD